ncbi:T9SS type A sorting domain-containing protein [Mucilaginibacter limnophilus]|uniref:T9SS type A sorting domain-containing protein n=1 Tax=Mucilaginibacter limnophilus TaxID=1932778 RepID=A0A3S2UJY0_9SPHI|nr:S8 family serine peptidase [Mucilaginibacter limnophilus]RVT98202.1 T9SS type A sorting domain-containing protein [Mucilaginibacter limnophilus]
MKRLSPAAIACFILVFFAADAFSQRRLVTENQRKNLEDFAGRLRASSITGRDQARALAASKNWAVRKVSSSGAVISLQGVNRAGFPIFLRTSNTEAAAATRTNTVQPGGELGLNLSGSSSILNNKLAIWDGGIVYTNHREFNGKTITIAPGQTNVDEHATHVAGTLIARGATPLAKGMAFGMSTLHSFDYDKDAEEMSDNAGGLILSNHSYGDIAGWDDNTWYGLPGDTVDYLFGFYDDRAQAWDKIAYEAPYYLIVESAGNSHAYNGPAVGSTYYGYKSRTDPEIVEKGPRPETISNNDGFDVLPTTANAKNILTIGSVGSLPDGPDNINDLVISNFGSWGPTDDGRVKPDLCGMGESVYSTLSFGTNAYGYKSGTSMSTPNVTGSLLLLQEYYSKLHSDSLMLSSTLKGLVCHTAFDGGNPGPDYKFGWGLLDMRKAAQTITNNGTSTYIKEASIQQGQTQTYSISTTGTEPLVATIAWTDPEGTPSAAGTINDRSPKLVNDLDIKISGNGIVYQPWVLDPEHPSAVAKTGNNNVDNVEQVRTSVNSSANTYEVTISHKGVLQHGGQNYSLIISGAKVTGTTTTNTTEGLSVFPVPTNQNNKLTVLYNVKQAGSLKLQLINLAGYTVYSTQQNVPSGNFNAEIGVGTFASGVYVLKLSVGNEVETRKVLVVK